MRRERAMALPLVGSAASLAAGGALLYANSLVPPQLALGGLAASALLLVLAACVWRQSRAAVEASTVLAAISIVSSPFIAAHRKAMLGFGSNSLLDVLDVLQILGFYVFPATFLALRLSGLRRRRAEGQNTQTPKA